MWLRLHRLNNQSEILVQTEHIKIIKPIPHGCELEFSDEIGDSITVSESFPKMAKKLLTGSDEK